MLRLFTDDSIAGDIPFKDVRRKAFALLPAARIDAVADCLATTRASMKRRSSGGTSIKPPSGSRSTCARSCTAFEFEATAADDPLIEAARFLTEASRSGKPLTSYKELDSGEKFTSDLPYKQPESTKSSGQRELQAQACENMLRTRSAISNNPGAREVIPSTSVGWIFVTKESPSP